MKISRHREKIVITDLLYKLFYLFYSGMLLWILVLNFVENMNVNLIVFPVSLLFLTFIIIFIYLFQSRQRKTEKQMNLKIIFLFFLFLFISISIIGINLRVAPTWDYYVVHAAAFEWVKEGQIHDLSYFARYPNNNMMLVIITLFYKVLQFFFPNGSSVGFITASIVLNSLLIAGSIILTAMTAKNKFGNKFFYYAMFFTIFLTPIVLYSEILYTDTVGLFMISLIIYFIASKGSYLRVFDFIMVALLIVIGYQIKAFVIIILVGLFIVILLKKKIRWIKKITLILVLMTSFFIGTVMVTSLLNKTIGITEELYDQYQFPLSHWVMMSLNPKMDGGFNDEDYQFTKAISGKEQKEIAIKKRIETRVNDFGVKGLFNHTFFKKMSRTWTNGSMASDDYANRKNIYDGILQSYFTNSGDKHYIYVVYSQAAHIVVIVLMLITGIRSFFIRKDFMNLLNISIFGLILFLMIWECNPRYIYSFIPLFILAALYAFDSTVNDQKSKQNQVQVTRRGRHI